jgi:hypothetical protein
LCGLLCGVGCKPPRGDTIGKFDTKLTWLVHGPRGLRPEVFNHCSIRGGRAARMNPVIIFKCEMKEI